MGSDRWYEAWSALPLRPRPEPPWQPDEAAVLRRVRLDTAWHLVLGAVWAGALVARVLGDRGGDDLVAPIIWLCAVAITLARLHVPGWRDGYRRQLREDVRVRHALRAHVDVGEAHRETVTDRARLRRWGIPVLVVGCPLVIGLLLRAVLDGGVDAVALGGSAFLVLLYLVGLVVWPRQWREARRWLADPLPRGDVR